jgi:rhodanese-related sulfurtransferase
VKQHSPGFLRLVDDAKTRVREVPVSAVQAKLARRENLYLVDVREDSEWAQGHALGALHIGRGVLERDIEKLIPDVGAEIVLYCGGGYRSALAADSLLKLGYRNVASLAGGWSAWTQAGAPTS